MEKSGSIYDRVIDAALMIDDGRKGLMRDGEKGRVSYQEGVIEALQVFEEVRNTKNSEVIMRTEWAFLKQELQLCESSDKLRIRSLNQAITDFDDALKSLGVVNEKIAYQKAEKTHSTSGGYRTQGLPKDAFHKACNSHKTRLQNALKTPLITYEKSLYHQRVDNLKEVKSIYMERQKEALGLSKDAKVRDNERER